MKYTDSASSASDVWLCPTPPTRLGPILCLQAYAVYLHCQNGLHANLAVSSINRSLVVIDPHKLHLTPGILASWRRPVGANVVSWAPGGHPAVCFYLRLKALRVSWVVGDIHRYDPSCIMFCQYPQCIDNPDYTSTYNVPPNYMDAFCRAGGNSFLFSLIDESQY